MVKIWGVKAGGRVRAPPANGAAYRDGRRYDSSLRRGRLPCRKVDHAGLRRETADGVGIEFLGREAFLQRHVLPAWHRRGPLDSFRPLVRHVWVRPFAGQQAVQPVVHEQPETSLPEPLEGGRPRIRRVQLALVAKEPGYILRRRNRIGIFDHPASMPPRSFFVYGADSYICAYS